MAEREYRVLVHEEEGSYWAEVAELPGCFASGTNLDELRAAVIEAISLYVSDETAPSVAPSITAQGGDARPRFRMTTSRQSIHQAASFVARKHSVT